MNSLFFTDAPYSRVLLPGDNRRPTPRRRDGRGTNPIVGESAVLIAEDDARVARAWERTIRPLRQAVLATTASEARRLFDGRTAWAGVVIDVHLGDEAHDGYVATGIDVAEFIRARNGVVPCAIVTGNHGRREVVNAADRLECRLIAKPATAVQLRSFLLDVATFDTDCDVATAAAVRRLAMKAMLSPKEAAVLIDLMSPQARKESASHLGIETGTLKTFANRIREKLGVATLDDVRACVREEMGLPKRT